MLRPFAVLLLIALTGCTVPGQDLRRPLLIDGLIFENQSQSPVSGVQLLVPATGGFVSCGQIAPGNFCSTTFPEVRFSGNEFEVTWSQAGGNWSTGLVKPDPDAAVLAAGVAEVRVVIVAPGSAGALLLAGEGQSR